MFKKLAALSAKAHQDLRLSSVFSYDHAAAEAWVPFGLGEAGAVAREYAIVFASDGEHEALPVALTGVAAGRNDYIDASGQWQARYVPAHVRRYPFITGQARAKTGRQLVLMFDAEAPHFKGGKGLPFFDAAGEPTELVGRVEKVLTDLQQDFLRARGALKSLEAEGLLIQQVLRITRKGGQVHDIKGMRVLDFKKFGELDADALLRLRNSGALMLAHAHFFSLSNLRDGVLSQSPAARSPSAGVAAAAVALPAGLGLPQDEALNFDGIDWSKLGGEGGQH